MLAVNLRTTFYPDQATRLPKEKTFDRLKEAARFLRRTVRAVVGQYAPTSFRRRTADGRIVQVFGAGAAPGDPPFKRRGTLQSHVGFNAAKGTVMEAGVSVESYGMEAGTGQYRKVRHPHLGPTYRLNLGTIRQIILGQTAAPQTGSLLPAVGRSGQKRLKLVKAPKMKAAKVRRRRSS